MEKPTATPRPKAEATSSNSSKTVANNVSAKRASMITGFFQNVGVSHTNSLPDYCNNKNFYSNIIRHALKPDQVLRGRLTCILTVTPALGVTNFPLFFSNSSFFFFFPEMNGNCVFMGFAEFLWFVTWRVSCSYL